MTLLLAYDCGVIVLILNECTSNEQTVQADIMSSQGDIKPTKSLVWSNAILSWQWLAFLFNNTSDSRSKSSGWASSASPQKTFLIQRVQVRHFCRFFHQKDSSLLDCHNLYTGCSRYAWLMEETYSNYCICFFI